MTDSVNQTAGCGPKDAVCVDVGRVYDSCMDRDCAENLRVYFSEKGQSLIQNAISARVKSAEVDDVQINVEPVSFNRGFYSCDITFYFIVNCEVITGTNRNCCELCGVAAFSKRVILCGSEGSVKTFTSTDEDDEITSNLPKCSVQCVDPVVLDSKICDVCPTDCCCSVPDNLLRRIDGDIYQGGNRALYVTLGLFSIVQLTRNVQLLIPVFDFCVPHKECHDTTDSPCEMFNRICFPTEEFFPSADVCKKKCGCDAD